MTALLFGAAIGAFTTAAVGAAWFVSWLLKSDWPF